MNSEQLEKYTSAITLSDMEIFVFPELMYSLVLANIMGPIIWQWRQLNCFKKLEGKSSYRKLKRLRQFIMDEFEFNLDLETWGLTSKAKELNRFEKFISPGDFAKSNALFGCHGDKYYFDADIAVFFTQSLTAPPQILKKGLLRIRNPLQNAVTPCKQRTLKSDLTNTCQNPNNTLPEDRDLVKIIEVWSNLSDEMRKSIIKMKS